MRRVIHLLAIATALGFAGATWAADYQGRITDTDRESNTFTMQLDDGNEMQFRVGDDTITRKDAQIRAFGDIVAGDRARVTVDEAAEGEVPTAQRVDVLEGSASTDPGVEGAGIGGIAPGTTKGERTASPDEEAGQVPTGAPADELEEDL